MKRICVFCWILLLPLLAVCLVAGCAKNRASKKEPAVVSGAPAPATPPPAPMLSAPATNPPAAAMASTNDTEAELKALVEKVQAKLDAGKNTESDLKDELKGFDDLAAEHRGEKTDAVAHILFMKAMLYLQVFNNSDKTAEIMQQVKDNYPDTTFGQEATRMLASLDREAQAQKIHAELKPGTAFPTFAEQDVAGQPLVLTNYLGKIVLIDFWATWCGPCRAELPNVLGVFKKHHDQGFEIIGVSLDDDKAALERFTKENAMTWPQYFDGLGWNNKLAVQYGIQSIPATFLLDRNGKILGSNLRGDQLQEAVANAVAQP